MTGIIVRFGFLIALYCRCLADAQAAKLYVTNMSDDSLRLLKEPERTPKMERHLTIPVGKMPHVPVLSPDGKRLYIYMAGSDEVGV